MSDGFTAVQPKDGDLVVGCDHMKDGQPYHFFGMSRGASMPMIDRRTEEPIHPQWLVCCDECFRASGGNPERIAWMGLHDWKGDGPIIKRSVRG